MAYLCTEAKLLSYNKRVIFTIVFKYSLILVVQRLGWFNTSTTSVHRSTQRPTNSCGSTTRLYTPLQRPNTCLRFQRLGCLPHKILMLRRLDISSHILQFSFKDLITNQNKTIITALTRFYDSTNSFFQRAWSTLWFAQHFDRSTTLSMTTFLLWSYIPRALPIWEHDQYLCYYF